jgi:hypothetical protein
MSVKAGYATPLLHVQTYSQRDRARSRHASASSEEVTP